MQDENHQEPQTIYIKLGPENRRPSITVTESHDLARLSVNYIQRPSINYIKINWWKPKILQSQIEFLVLFLLCCLLGCALGNFNILSRPFMSNSGKYTLLKHQLLAQLCYQTFDQQCFTDEKYYWELFYEIYEDQGQPNWIFYLIFVIWAVLFMILLFQQEHLIKSSIEYVYLANYLLTIIINLVLYDYFVNPRIRKWIHDI